MTGLLTEVMHERADATSIPALDLDAIVREGNRRVRRHRALSGLAATAVLGTVTAGALALSGLTGGQGDLAADSQSFQDRRAAFALGSTIHFGDTTFDVGRPVASLVQTDGGLVYTTGDGDVRVFDGASSEVVGHAEGSRLRADDTGSLVAWVTLAEDGHPQYVVYDTAAREEVARVDDLAAGPSVGPADQGAQVFAVDDGTVYWRHGGDLVRYDVQDGQEAVVHSADPAAKADPVVTGIVDVAYGTIAYTVEGGRDRWGVAVGQRPDPGGTVLAAATRHAFLSPDATLIAADEHDAMAVYASKDGQPLPTTVDGYLSVVGFGWTDDDTVAVLALRERTRTRVSGDVLTCDVSDDTCTVVSSFDDVAPGSLVPADGDPAS